MQREEEPIDITKEVELGKDMYWSYIPTYTLKEGTYYLAVSSSSNVIAVRARFTTINK